MIAKKKLLETIIDIDKLANIILVKEASLNQGQVEQEEQINQPPVLDSSSTPTSYLWSARSAHYKALILARRANEDARKKRRNMIKQRVNEQFRSQLDHEFNINSDFVKAPRESCREFLIITVGSLLASFIISFGLFYLFKDYDGLLTGILFL